MVAAAARSLRSRPLWGGDVGELDAFTFFRLLPSAGEDREDWGWDRWQSRSSLPAWHIRGLDWSVSPSFPGQATAQPAALATRMVARREVCLFCPVSCTNSCLSTPVNNSATAAGVGQGAVGRSRADSSMETVTGRGQTGARSPASQPWPSNRAGGLKGPGRSVWAWQLLLGDRTSLLKPTQDTWALMAAPDWKQA